VSPAAAHPAIELKGLGRRFGERTALKDITLTLQPGQTLAVLGPNGAGKSTLLRILATLLTAHEGEAAILGEPLPRNAYKVRRLIGFLAHEPLLYSDLSARENLSYHARLRRLPQRAADDLLSEIGLESRADEPVRLLSRGLTQRVAIARAVLHDPPILLLDEPRANLDPGAAELLEPLIGRASGKTRVITSHDAQSALGESDLALGLRDGRQAFVTDKPSIDQARELYAP
jgi:heme exporter protein A